MRYHILFWITILTLLGTKYVSGQDVQGSATMTASAELTTPITVTPGDNIATGTIIQGTSKFISALTGAVDAAAATTTGSKDGLVGGEQRGFIRVQGGPSDGAFNVEVTVPSDLESEDGDFLAIRFDTNKDEETRMGFNGAIVSEFPGNNVNLTNSAASYDQYTPQGGDAKVNDNWTSSNFGVNDGPDGFSGAGVTYTINEGDRNPGEAFQINDNGAWLVLGAMIEARDDQPVRTYSGEVIVTFILGD